MDVRILRGNPDEVEVAALIAAFELLVPRAGNQAHNSPAQLPAGGVAGRAQVRSSTRATRRLASENLDPPTYAPHSRRGAPVAQAEHAESPPAGVGTE